MKPIIYNIPAKLYKKYLGRPVIVRSADPKELLDLLPVQIPENIKAVQLLAPGVEPAALSSLWYALPVDLVMRHPAGDFPLLYEYAPLLAQHPVRISLAVVPGFSKAVKLAAALNFAVKLEISQFHQELLEELTQSLHFYLYQSTVNQPVEFFHSLFAAFYRAEPLTLWQIQEEDVSCHRYVNDMGEETISPRLAELAAGREPGPFFQDFLSGLSGENSPCRGCEFLENCGGFFQLPRWGYDCRGVKTLLQLLQEAAGELRRDLTAADQAGAAEQQ